MIASWCSLCNEAEETNSHLFFYCLEKVTFDEFVYWVCDDCEVKEPDEINIKKSDAISIENRDCTSSRHRKVSSEVKIDVCETILKRCEGTLQQLHQPPVGIDLVEHCQMAGDNSGMKMSKKKSSPTSLGDEKFEPRLVHSSSEQCHESQTSIECNERTQSDNVSPLPDKRPKEDVTAPLAKLARENFQDMIEKTESISLSGNHHEKESVSGKNIRLTPQTSTVLREDPSQFLKGEQPNEPKHAVQDRAMPLIDFIWRGSFNIWNKEYDTFDGLLAHLSVKACQKVYEETSLFPALLQLEMLPKSDVWPKSFTISEPTDDNIALYFFPSDTRCEKEFDQLVEQMIGEELALRAIVTNAELLVFTSTELPLLYWRFQGKYYLWGVFKSKRGSSGNTMPNGRSEPATCPTPGNELAFRDGGDVVISKT
ncbi:unnamed protein product [Withania somnifera]